jgi:hypothetical protein
MIEKLTVSKFDIIRGLTKIFVPGSYILPIDVEIPAPLCTYKRAEQIFLAECRKLSHPIYSMILDLPIEKIDIGVESARISLYYELIKHFLS